MSRTLPIDLDEVCSPGRCQRWSGLHGAWIRWVLFACFAVMAGCSGVGTKIDHVWLDQTRGNVALGKTLVLALIHDVEVVVMLENEWTRQLRDRGIDASSANLLLPGEIPPAEERVIELLKAGGFETLLVSRVVDVKQVEREVSAYQVAVVETKLYDTKTEQPFWSVLADTYLVNPTGERITRFGSERAHEFVGVLIEEMSKSKLL